MKILTDDPRYNRDSFSSAIIAKDKLALEKHRKKVRQINDLKSDTKEINNLKKEINEIKETLSIIMNYITKENSNGNN